MTDNQTTTETTEQTEAPSPGATAPETSTATGTEGGQDTPTPAEDAAEDQDAGAGDARLHKARKDAAGYRTRLRDTEAERDTLTAELATTRDALSAARRAQAENIVPGVKLDVLERIGLDLTEHLTETGAVDMDAARDAARALAKDAGILPATGARVPSAGHGVESPLRSGNWLSDTLM